VTTAILDENLISEITRCDVLGVQVSAVNMAMAVRQIHQWIDRRECNYVCITGVHGVMESQRDPKLKQIHNSAGLVTPDGMPMVWINKLRGNSFVQRVYGPDLMLEIVKQGVDKGHKHYFYGGLPGVPELLAQKLSEKAPGLEVAGTFSPPFGELTEAQDHEIVSNINRSGADVVWVGLSTPKQERWMARHLGRIHAPVMVGVGAAFDFHAGLKRQAPRWIGKLGMEWFYRLCSEPKRLWKRYLINNPSFCWNFMLQTLGLRDFGAGIEEVSEVSEPAKASKAA
jgi:N-acetylglucosaminyldiphosphoundecaprenol N-acetyl-beta-D-mannosaminyltransferase